METINPKSSETQNQMREIHENIKPGPAKDIKAAIKALASYVKNQSRLRGISIQESFDRSVLLFNMAACRSVYSDRPGRTESDKAILNLFGNTAKFLAVEVPSSKTVKIALPAGYQFGGPAP